jgi:hypothetical protein
MKEKNSKKYALITCIQNEVIKIYFESNEDREKFILVNKDNDFNLDLLGMKNYIKILDKIN